MPKRPTLLTALALLACALSLFPDLWTAGPDILLTPGDDAADHFAPWLEFGSSELRAGRLPLWNPHQFSGTPFFGAFESALLYPVNWLHLILPAAAAINAGLILHIFLGGFFTALWCRRLGSSPPAAALAGLLFMFSGPFFLRVDAGHLPLLASMAWAPALFWALESYWSAPSRRWMLAGMLFVCLQILAGNPQCLYYTLLAIALYTVAGQIQKTIRVRDAATPLYIYLGGAALAAVQLLTGIDAAGESVRGGGVYYDFAASFSLPAENLLTVLAPRLFGDRLNFPYFGRWYFWETCLFMSATGFFLAGYGLTGGTLKRRRTLGILAVFFLLLALGPQTPLHRLFYYLLPGFGMFRGTAKFAFLAALAAAALAAAGYDRLREAKSPPRGLMLLAAGASLLLWLAGSRLSASAPSALNATQDVLSGLHASRQTFLHSNFYETSTAAVADYAGGQLQRAALFPAALAFLIFLSRHYKQAQLGIAFLLAGEILFFAQASRSSRARLPDYPPSWTNTARQSEGNGRVLHHFLNYPNAAMTRGSSDLWGYGSFVLRRYAEFIAATQGTDPGKASQYLWIKRFPAALTLTRLETVFPSTPSDKIIERPEPMPRLALIKNYAHSSGRDQTLRALMEPSFDPRRLIVLEEEPDPRPTPGGRGGRLELLKEDGDSLEIEAVLEDSAVLLITDAYSSGWRVKSLIKDPPQNRYALLPADHAFRAVPLAAGSHRLLIEYSPLSFRIGIWISLLAWAFYLLAWVRELRLKR